MEQIQLPGGCYWESYGVANKSLGAIRRANGEYLHGCKASSAKALAAAMQSAQGQQVWDGWQPQTYSNGNHTGRDFRDVDDEGKRLRLYREKDGRIWAMFYPKAGDETHCYQPGIGNVVGKETAFPTDKQMAEWKAAAQPQGRTPSAWQSIDTAPENTPCLVVARWKPTEHNPHQQARKVFVACFLKPSAIPCEGRWIACQDGFERELDEVECWQPIPEPEKQNPGT